MHHMGLLIISATISLFFLGLSILQPSRTSRNLPLIGFPISLGLALVIYASISKKVDFFSILTASFLTLSWFVYLMYSSSFGDRTSLMLKVGKKFPNIVLETADAALFSSEVFLGSPTVYLFYRGNWCPLCVGQVKELVSAYKKLALNNINIVFVSPQPHRYSKKLAKQHGLEFNFLTDSNNKVARQLGIEDINGVHPGLQLFGYKSNTVLPTLIVTNKNNTITYADLTDNYRLRPDPETFLKIASP